MATKAELIAQITALKVPEGHTAMTEEELGKLTNAELEQMIANAAENSVVPGEGEPGEGAEDKVAALAAPGGVTRRKVNRGSTRRINRALETLKLALDSFADEIDRQGHVHFPRARVDVHRQPRAPALDHG